MLREFFPRDYARYEASPFARELEDFGAWLEATGYSRQCARGHLFRLRDSLEQFSPAKLGAVYTVAQLESAFGTMQKGVPVRRSMLYRVTERAFQRFLASRQRLAIAPVDGPFADIRRLYRRELLKCVACPRRQYSSTIGRSATSLATRYWRGRASHPSTLPMSIDIWPSKAASSVATDCST